MFLRCKEALEQVWKKIGHTWVLIRSMMRSLNAESTSELEFPTCLQPPRMVVPEPGRGTTVRKLAYDGSC